MEAGFGLGEAIVSGQVIPDAFVISHEGLELKETRLGRKQTRPVSTVFDTLGQTVSYDELHLLRLYLVTARQDRDEQDT